MQQQVQMQQTTAASTSSSQATLTTATSTVQATQGSVTVSSTAEVRFCFKDAVFLYYVPTFVPQISEYGNFREGNIFTL